MYVKAGGSKVEGLDSKTKNKKKSEKERKDSQRKPFHTCRKFASDIASGVGRTRGRAEPWSQSRPRPQDRTRPTDARSEEREPGHTHEQTENPTKETYVQEKWNFMWAYTIHNLTIFFPPPVLEKTNKKMMKAFYS